MSQLLNPWAPEEPVDPHVVEIERARLREIISHLPEAARPLDDAIPRLVSLTVAESSFTSFTYSLAIAYGEVEAYTLQELRHRTRDTTRIREGVAVSLQTWQDAEHASTVRWT
ncbi:hypothetical protein [Nonomuraea jiangxiensis]|uniref:Uncharacterized protein n=1 Tax=Nonomuraea jiangxiensis TaxID=633440 RepID=A0A1G8EKL1_9ACTN|nr:hypothetical protein [Nonomuraea jiangxiensis]SDH70396.1 hypothetical protein SAMN05421869_10319 [Nonomuraea jiangxiensis]